MRRSSYRIDPLLAPGTLEANSEYRGTPRLLRGRRLSIVIVNGTLSRPGFASLTRPRTSVSVSCGQRKSVRQNGNSVEKLFRPHVGANVPGTRHAVRSSTVPWLGGIGIDFGWTGSSAAVPVPIMICAVGASSYFDRIVTSLASSSMSSAALVVNQIDSLSTHIDAASSK